VTAYLEVRARTLRGSWTARGRSGVVERGPLAWVSLPPTCSGRIERGNDGAVSRPYPHGLRPSPCPDCEPNQTDPEAGAVVTGRSELLNGGCRRERSDLPRWRALYGPDTEGEDVLLDVCDDGKATLRLVGPRSADPADLVRPRLNRQKIKKNCTSEISSEAAVPSPNYTRGGLSPALARITDRRRPRFVPPSRSDSSCPFLVEIGGKGPVPETTIEVLLLLGTLGSRSTPGSHSEIGRWAYFFDLSRNSRDPSHNITLEEQNI
jgi:hypothetical protein